MVISKTTKNEEITLIVEGRIDTLTSPEFQKQLFEAIGSGNRVVVNLGGVHYISSSALRIFLLGQKEVNQNKKELLILNPQTEIMNVFQMTGFSNILTIKNSN